MIDYIVKYKYNKFDDIELNSDTIITLENDYIEDTEVLEELLLEQLKEDLDMENVEILDVESVNKRDNIYRFTYDDVYFE